MPNDLTTLQRTFDFHDGSHYQSAVAPVNVTALYNGSTKIGGRGPAISWKATQSTSGLDTSFPGMRKQFNDAGFRDIFMYHWLSSTTDPVAQAKHYLDVTGKWSKSERCMIDAEEKGTNAAKTVSFAKTIESFTRVPCAVYTGLYVADIWKSPAVRMSDYGPRPMHLAAYISAADLIARLKVLGILDLPIHFWQYSSDGPAPGVAGRADLNHICDWSMIDAPAPPPPVIVTPPSIYRPQDLTGEEDLMINLYIHGIAGETGDFALLIGANNAATSIAMKSPADAAQYIGATHPAEVYCQTREQFDAYVAVARSGDSV